jgi:hypothetical protein
MCDGTKSIPLTINRISPIENKNPMVNLSRMSLVLSESVFINLPYVSETCFVKSVV